jgi:hypothetical protein
MIHRAESLCAGLAWFSSQAVEEALAVAVVRLAVSGADNMRQTAAIKATV